MNCYPLKRDVLLRWDINSRWFKRSSAPPFPLIPLKAINVNPKLIIHHWMAVTAEYRWFITATTHLPKWRWAEAHMRWSVTDVLSSAHCLPPPGTKTLHALFYRMLLFFISFYLIHNYRSICDDISNLIAEPKVWIRSQQISAVDMDWSNQLMISLSWAKWMQQAAQTFNNHDYLMEDNLCC